MDGNQCNTAWGYMYVTSQSSQKTRHTDTTLDQRRRRRGGGNIGPTWCVVFAGIWFTLSSLWSYVQWKSPRFIYNLFHTKYKECLSIATYYPQSVLFFYLEDHFVFNCCNVSLLFSVRRLEELHLHRSTGLQIKYPSLIIMLQRSSGGTLFDNHQ